MRCAAPVAPGRPRAGPQPPHSTGPRACRTPSIRSRPPPAPPSGSRAGSLIPTRTCAATPCDRLRLGCRRPRPGRCWSATPPARATRPPLPPYWRTWHGCATSRTRCGVPRCGRRRGRAAHRGGRRASGRHRGARRVRGLARAVAGAAARPAPPPGPRRARRGTGGLRPTSDAGRGAGPGRLGPGAVSPPRGPPSGPCAPPASRRTWRPRRPGRPCTAPVPPGPPAPRDRGRRSP